jgi:hypothetical protein
MKTVSREQVATSERVGELALPPRVQEALGQLAGSAKEGLLALSVGLGLGVLAELLEEEVVEVVGAKGKHDPERVAVRHGRESGEVTLGGRRVAVERPRVRSADGRSELPLQNYAHFADRDQLSRVVLERMLAGVSTRRYRRTQEPVGSEVERAARSTSHSAVSRTFVERVLHLAQARRDGCGLALELVGEGAALCRRSERARCPRGDGCRRGADAVLPHARTRDEASGNASEPRRRARVPPHFSVIVSVTKGFRPAALRSAY